MHRDPQSFRNRDQLIVGNRPLAALDFRDLRLVQLDPEARDAAGHILLRDLRTSRDPQTVDILAGDVASLAFGIQSALEGALILLLFPAGIILFQNKNAAFVVPKPNEPLSLLCVDDHTLVGDALAEVFRTAGYFVDRVGNGEAAWATLTADPERFDVVVTDHQIPRIDGLELVTRLRAAAFPGRIIVYSSALVDKDVVRYRALQVDAIVVKGPDAARLIAIVDAVNKHS